MFDINLVPEIQKQKQQLAKKNTYVTVAGSVLVGGVILGLVILGSLKVAADITLNNTKKDIEAVKEESAQYRELEESVLSLERGLAGLKDTVDGRNNWTLLLPHLETATPNDTQYRSLAIEGTTVTAQLSGRNVESIARFIESYKKYQVVTISGTGEPQEIINFTNGDNSIGTTTVKSNGTWVYSFKNTLTEDFQIKAKSNTAENSQISYTVATKSLKVDSGSASAVVKSLFTNINTKQYTKEGENVNFDATFSVATEALW
jgi:VCBS repeat-containing protein